jgi:anti-anti-sigma factor
MNVVAESYGQAVVLNCKGELTVDSLEAFKRVMAHQLEDGQVRDVVLNLQEVPFLDSAALAYLLDLQEQMGERLGQLKLAGLDANLAKILEVTGLESAFERCQDVSQAVKAV